ncbi:hypothetical protein RSOLAG1IB_06102 [Rhizoctonia solani AG-1 IB]|uniref:Carbohydrate-binding module family 19 domain-containing protein n=1 Tax=Thanatephorus cucumeris (strain AG1-IB / isolate 7/3/14) TaxID=1108050 RepID=A0A0B7F819_THACB|nr:hypothetical protein RSOLAG1IB_06102 [Rhizoctonia solani AG-1 IB]
MKSKTVVEVVCGALVCAAAISGLPQSAGHKADRLRPRYSLLVDATKTVTVTVSLGPSTSAALGRSTSTVDPCTDENTPTSISSTTTSSRPSAIISTITLTTEFAITVFPSATPSVSSSLSSETFESTTSPPTTAATPSASPATSSTTSSTSSLVPPPAPTPTDPNFNPITAPATGGGNAVLAQNAADAQALNRKFKELTFTDRCVDGDEACVGDGPVICTLGAWRRQLCREPNTRCRAVPRMQTNGTAIGCYTQADLKARFSSTGQPGNAFGE